MAMLTKENPAILSNPIVKELRIICCPECIKKKKIKRFSEERHLNTHLKMKHNFPYKIRVNGSASFIPRTS